MNIIELAKEAGFSEDSNCEIYGSHFHLERFADLVRADERMKALEVARTIGGYCAVEFEQEYLK